MPVIILLILIALPLAEIAVFILIGEEIGVWPTVTLVFLSAFAGLMLLRIQGFVTLTRVRAALNRGETPAAELFRGACLLVAGILLLIPGFLTDAVALLLLLPPVRDGLGWALSRRVGRTDVHVWSDRRGSASGRGDRPPGRRGPVIEGDFEELPPHDDGRNADGDPPRTPPNDEPDREPRR